jgi:beta-galactosidase/beta-glucuronidase
MGNRAKRIFSLLVFVAILICDAVPMFSSEKKILLRENWFLQSTATEREGGQKISSSEFSPKDWFPTHLPTTVLTALVKNGVYPDPYIGMNNMRIPDASDEFNQQYGLEEFSHLPGKINPWRVPYWFWTQFRLPEDFRGKIIWLNLEGINYRAEVWLNGNQVADSKTLIGMFGSWAFDISGFYNFDEINTLAVKIFPLDYPGLPAAPQLAAFGPFGPNGGLTGDIGKNVTMQCSVGWDWMPAVRDRNMGIWQDVYLSATGPVDVRHPHIVTDLDLPDLDNAEIKIEADLANCTESLTEGTVTAAIRPKNFSGSEIILQRKEQIEPGQVKTVLFDKDTFGDLLIENPALWWPNGYGKQCLYELEMDFKVDGEISDVERQTFGIRKIGSRISMVEGWARRDFFVNDKRILIRGGAWVPDMMLNRGPEKLHDELQLSREANLNIVRIWGGGLTPPEEFFTICDELGLLVWHDFWITGDCQGTWGKGSQDYPYDAAAFLKNAEDVVKRLRNHPSLLVWTAGNEGYPREEIYVPLRDELLAKMDGTRPFLPSSGYREPPEGWGLSWPDNQAAGTYSGGPYHWVHPAEYYRKVEEGKDWLFKNEVGLPSLPCLDSLKKFIPDLSADPDVKFPLNNIWGYHDACEGNGKYSLYDAAIRRRYGEPTDLEDYVKKAQVINAESYRAIFESVNQAVEDVAGVILWKTNPAWPSVIWQLYDWYLCPHAGYYYAKIACEPLHVQLDINDLNVVVVNHHLEPKEVFLSGNAFSQDLKKVWSVEDRIRMGPASSVRVMKVEIPEEIKKDILYVELLLENDQGDVVSENFYWLAGDDDYTFLQTLPEVDLDVGIDGIVRGERLVVDLHVTNPSDALAFFVHPTIRRKNDGGEVLPSYWSGNYFCLLPGRTKGLTVEFKKSDLLGQKAFMELEGWNIRKKILELEI